MKSCIFYSLRYGLASVKNINPVDFSLVFLVLWFVDLPSVNIRGGGIPCVSQIILNGNIFQDVVYSSFFQSVMHYKSSFVTGSSPIAPRYLSYLSDTNLIKSQDVFTVLRYISLNSYGKTMAWDWVRLNWDYLVSR